MGNWIFCRRCDPTLYALAAGGLGSIGQDLTFPNECPGCNVCFINIGFATEAVAQQVVGAGNYVNAGGWSTGEWVLFYDGGNYVRDPSRPVACEVGTIEHPDDPTLDLVTSVSVNDGAFIWTRRSNVSSSPDFLYFDLTAGVIDAPVCACGPCVSISLERHRVAFAWEDPVEDFVAEVTLPSSGAPCVFDPPCEDAFHSPVCLAFTPTYQGWFGPVDGWGFGGQWRWGDYYEGVDGYDCPEAAILTIYGELFDACDPAEAGQFVAANLCCELVLAWEGCDRDPRTIPTEADFTVVLSDPCTGSLDNLTYGGECVGDGTINCPPEDCPVQWCKWQWNVDTQSWDLIASNCIAPAECPGPPADPALTDFPWVECNCCFTVVPQCDAASEPCLTPDCSWTWSAATETWSSTDCIELDCTCRNELGDPGGPTEDGLFDGEIRPGICCKPLQNFAEGGQPLGDGGEEIRE